MFTKTVIALCAALVLGTSFASVAQAQSAPAQVKRYSDFEKMWFAIPHPPGSE